MPKSDKINEVLIFPSLFYKFYFYYSNKNMVKLLIEQNL